VVLKAVETLGSRTVDEEVRRALVGALDNDYSTSVVLQSLEALDDYVGKDSAVKTAYIRVMSDDRMSSTARINAGERLAPVADGRLREQIADAMEDVILELSKRGRWSRHEDLIEDALDVLEVVDPERAERLAKRYQR
jgi:hypothetical protein